MTTQIHPTAIVETGAKIGNNVSIGAYSIIGKDVSIGDNTIVKSHVVIEGITEIGSNNVIFQFSSIGAVPQDLKFAGELSKTIIGNNNKIREFVTINAGTKGGIMETRVGNNCLVMAYCHIAHDCVVGNNVVLANNATLAGHVIIEDGVVVGGLSAIHQFVRIGRSAMIGGMSGVESDVIPYGMVMGERASLAGLNLVGLKRQNLEKDEINSLRGFYKKLFDKSEGNFNGKVDALAPEYKESKLVGEVIKFLKSETSRSFCHPKA
ncbi:MAG: acyl-ACP--UDP-N-acetylglucosamine O-acyltransferase [Rickettsiaceae bacterium]|jgi:UDP-N-acetylglucosamine acyltransferase|nr:acyl-ACP--UDP-N-acetylglucosamine O-acyltransferase [Rickettsiaceae bacterium]